MKRESLVSTRDNDRVSIPLPDTLLYYLNPIKRQKKRILRRGQNTLWVLEMDHC